MNANVVSLKAGGGINAIIPQTIEEVFRLSKGIAESGLAPRDMNTAEKITVAILTGLEIGLPPMFAIQKIAVINGRPSIWGDAVPALLWARGFKLREWMAGETGTTRVAFCEVTRPDGTKIERAFSECDALKAGLLAKAGPWKQYPDRMLQMRARGFACRDGAADAMSGLHLAEELEQPPMKDITPASAPLEIPDIPDQEQTPTPIDQTAQMLPDGNTGDQILDPDKFLSALEDEIALCDSAEELAKITADNKAAIASLPKSYQAKANKVLKEAAE